MIWKTLLFSLAAAGHLGAAELTFVYGEPYVSDILTIDFASGAMSFKDRLSGYVQKETLKKPEMVGAHVKKLWASLKKEEAAGKFAKEIVQYEVTYVEAGVKTKRKISYMRPPGDYPRDVLVDDDQIMNRLASSEHYARHASSFLLADLLRGIVDTYFMASREVPSGAYECYFSPKGAASLPYDSLEYCTDHLKVMAEKPLPRRMEDAESHVYRFTCLRTFHEGFCVVLEIMPDGTAHLTYKMESGRGGYGAGFLRMSGQMSVSKSSSEEFVGWVNTGGFWTLPRHDRNSAGLDGSSWILEGVQDGKYHVIDRWSPEAGTFAREFGERMLKMAYWTVKDLY
jgi:hypothetical protein